MSISLFSPFQSLFIITNLVQDILFIMNLQYHLEKEELFSGIFFWRERPSKSFLFPPCYPTLLLSFLDRLTKRDSYFYLVTDGPWHPLKSWKLHTSCRRLWILITPSTLWLQLFHGSVVQDLSLMVYSHINPFTIFFRPVTVVRTGVGVGVPYKGFWPTFCQWFLSSLLLPNDPS